MPGTIILIMAVFSLWLGWRTPYGWTRRLLMWGPVIAIAGLVPLLASIVLDSSGAVVGNALGLGFMAVFGLIIGAGVMLAGFIARLLWS